MAGKDIALSSRQSGSVWQVRICRSGEKYKSGTVIMIIGVKV